MKIHENNINLNFTFSHFENRAFFCLLPFSYPFFFWKISTLSKVWNYMILSSFTHTNFTIRLQKQWTTCQVLHTNDGETISHACRDVIVFFIHYSIHFFINPFYLHTILKFFYISKIYSERNHSKYLPQCSQISDLSICNDISHHKVHVFLR